MKSKNRGVHLQCTPRFIRMGDIQLFYFDIDSNQTPDLGHEEKPKHQVLGKNNDSIQSLDPSATPETPLVSTNPMCPNPQGEQNHETPVRIDALNYLNRLQLHALDGGSPEIHQHPGEKQPCLME